MCGKTLSFPRYALSDGQRLFIADGGNDRVLVFNRIPTQNAAEADAVLGQPDEFQDAYNSVDLLVISAANVTPTPTSLAWDGQNLYVADGTDYRILIFSPAHPDVPLNSVLNGASRAVFAVASVTVGGTVTTNDTATVTINGTAYTYTVKANDTLETISKGLTALINAGAGNPSVLASEETGFATIRLVARQPGVAGNSITLTTSQSTKATVTLTASNGTLQGGASGAQIAPGSIVVLRGTNLSDTFAVAADAETLPFELAGVQLYFDGVRAGLFSVSPTEIKAQFPFVVFGANSVSAWVRTKHADGSVTVTDAINVQVVGQAPGLPEH
jgi:LysM repeat protein